MANEGVWPLVNVRWNVLSMLVGLLVVRKGPLEVVKSFLRLLIILFFFFAKYMALPHFEGKVLEKNGTRKVVLKYKCWL